MNTAEASPPTQVDGDEVRHHFAIGQATAYCGPNAVALHQGDHVDDLGHVDVAFERLVSTGIADLDELLAAADGWSSGAIAVRGGGWLRIAIRGRVSVVVDDRRLAASDDWQQHHLEFDRPITVELATDGDVDPEHVCVAGAVPARMVRRSFSPHGDDGGADAENRFGHTVARTVEDAAVRDPLEHPVVLGVLVFSSGERVVVDAPMVIGRNPRVPAAARPGRPPRLVRVAAPGVSRQHAEVIVDRWHAAIDDLGSSNGTRIIMPGRSATDLVPGSPVDLIPGAVVELGGDVSFTVEEIS